MSEGSLIMGTGRGKLGNMVLYRAGGQERQRAYISRIANPQSTGQTVNRSRFRITGVAYKSLAAASERISLASRATTAYNAFISRNVGKSPYHYKDFVEYCAQNGYALPAPWQVANGPLVTPSFLQTPVSFAQITTSIIGGSIDIDVPFAVQLANTSGTGSTFSFKDVLNAIWVSLGLSSEIHICSACGTRFPVSSSLFPSYSNREVLKSSIHQLVEIWPTSPELYNCPFSIGPNGFVDSVSTGATDSGGVPLAGSFVNNNCAVSIQCTPDTDAQINTWTIYFCDIRSSDATGAWGAVWIANGATDETSTANISLDAGGTTAYQALLTDAWRTQVLPSWRSSGSSSNEAVYEG